MATGRLARERVEIPAVPGAAQPALTVDALFDRAFTQRTTLVRAAVVHGAVLVIEMDKGKGRCADGDGLDPPVGQFAQFGDFVPGRLGSHSLDPSNAEATILPGADEEVLVQAQA